MLHGCSISNTITSAKGKVLGQASIEVLTDDILIDGAVVAPGEKIIIEAGRKEIIFRGEVVLKIPVSSGKESNEPKGMNGVGCLLFLPVCLLTSLGSPKGNIVRNVTTTCSARAEVITQAGELYEVRTRENSSNAPLLVVSRISSPRFIVAEEVMVCDKPDLPVDQE